MVCIGPFSMNRPLYEVDPVNGISKLAVSRDLVLSRVGYCLYYYLLLLSPQRALKTVTLLFFFKQNVQRSPLAPAFYMVSACFHRFLYDLSLLIHGAVYRFSFVFHGFVHCFSLLLIVLSG